MQFANDQALLLLLGIPFLLMAFWLSRRRWLRAQKRLGDAGLSRRLLERVSDTKGLLRITLFVVALFLLTLALARPQTGGKSTLVKREGIDILFVLDLSKSMLAKDIRPSRLQRAKLELNSLMDELRGDRVGLIGFAGMAFVQSPLTTDYAAARLFLKSMSPKDVPVQGTAVGSALKLAHTLLTETEGVAKSRLVVLLTDGEDHGEQMKDALALLKKDNIPVYAVGIGSQSGEPIPEEGGQGYKKSKDGKTVMSRMNESLLANAARSTGGRYVNLQAGSSLVQLKEYVSTMQKEEFESSLYTQYDEHFPWLLWPAFLCLLAAAVLDERRGSRWFGILREVRR